MSAKILIIYHSQSGNNELLAQECLMGVKAEEGCEYNIKKAFDTHLEDVIWADGIILCTPEYFGNMSGAIKDFFDRTYYPAREIELVKPFALMICCENDGTGAERNIMTLANGYVLKKVLDTLIIKEKDLHESLEIVREQAQTFAAGLSMGIF